KGVDPKATIMLAHAFLSLEYPGKAATHFAKLKPPPGYDKELPKLKGNENEKELEARKEKEDAIARYWGVQIQYSRAVRATKEKDSLKTAEAAAKAIVDNKNARYQMFARIERNLIIEDQERYREAYLEWQNFLKPLSGDLSKPEVQKIYFPSYVSYVRTLF